jgi:hypothetical protein
MLGTILENGTQLLIRRLLGFLGLSTSQMSVGCVHLVDNYDTVSDTTTSSD